MVQIVISSTEAGALAEWMLVKLQGEIRLVLLVETWLHFQGIQLLFQVHQPHWLQMEHIFLLVLITQARLPFQEG
uniref:Uncharacterized protein n=1 Tax=Peromyscus maniculatus bairdii TaxID=230844 RepID=A0A8C8UIH0_PERMB